MKDLEKECICQECYKQLDREEIFVVGDGSMELLCKECWDKSGLKCVDEDIN